jgi:hypothetical protein
MSIELFPIPFMDNIDTIPDIIIKQCKIEYEKSGKEKAYKILNDFLYNVDPSPTKRNLYLYRKAMLQTKKAYILGEGYIEKETDSGNIIEPPSWKNKKWSFLDTDSTIKLRNIAGRGYVTESQIQLDEYDSDLYYNRAYDSSTKLTVKHRGGKSVVRKVRFDFEYKYSTSEYYRECYAKSIYDIFKRIFFNTIDHTVYNKLLKEEAEIIYAILGLIPNELKLNIIKNMRNYILFEKENKDSQVNLSNTYRELFNKLQSFYQVNRDSYGEYTVKTIYDKSITNDERNDALHNISAIKEEYTNNVMLQSFKTFLSELHDTLLVPFEYIAYLMCALVNPRYEAIIEDTRGMIGTHIFGGNHSILPKDSSYFGPSQNKIQNNSVSALIPNIPLLHDDGVTLYENLFIVADDSFTISCYSYNKNKWLTDIPLVTENPIHALEENAERKLIKIIPCFDDGGDCVIWFIYSDYIVTYNCNTHEWIIESDNDRYHFVNFNIAEHLGAHVKAVQYDYTFELLFILDTVGNISVYDLDIDTKHIIPYYEIPQQPGDMLQDIKDFIILNHYSDNDTSIVEILCYNDNEVHIYQYIHKFGFNEIKQFIYTNDDAFITSIIKLNNDKRIYIIFSNHRIIELATYLYSSYEFKKKVNTNIKAITGNISYCNLNETAVYITSDHKLHMIHPIYTTKNRISTLELDLNSYISEGATIKRYTEYLIQDSSILLFSHSHYAIMAYLESLKQPLSKRT